MSIDIESQQHLETAARQAIERLRTMAENWRNHAGGRLSMSAELLQASDERRATSLESVALALAQALDAAEAQQARQAQREAQQQRQQRQQRKEAA